MKFKSLNKGPDKIQISGEDVLLFARKDGYGHFLLTLRHHITIPHSLSLTHELFRVFVIRWQLPLNSDHPAGTNGTNRWESYSPPV